MMDLALDKVDVLLIDADRDSRKTIRTILTNNGFQKITTGRGIADIESKFSFEMPDLLIADINLEDGSLVDFVRKLRHNEVGNNPFLPIIATAWSPTQDDVRSIVLAGADDIITKPLSTSQVLQRILLQIKARKPFIVTSAYIGPDRRKAGEKARPGKQMIKPIEVPNVLRAKALNASITELQKMQGDIDNCIASVNLQKLDRHAHQILYLVEALLPNLPPLLDPSDNVSKKTKSQLSRLQYVAQDTARRMVGTKFDHVSELCNSLIDVTERIIVAGTNPNHTDVELLKPLARAIQHGFDESDSEAARMAHEISKSVLDI